MAGGIGAIGIRIGAVLLVAAPLATIAMPRGDGPATAPVFAAPAPELAAAVTATNAPKPIAIPAAAPVEEKFVVKRVLEIDGPFRHGDYVWNDDGVPAGPVVITVDLAAQTMSVFRDGYEIGAAVITYGADDKPSPLGVFPITQKKKDHISNLYGAPMPYMLRLTNDGVAIHGSNVNIDAATHGCIGVPTAFAKLLFAEARLGDKVIITNGKMLQIGDPITAV